jgi:hypothetical protein
VGTSRHRCYPLFSPEDADLAELKWRSDRYGYARRTLNGRDENGKKTTKIVMAHRVVLERMLDRPLRRGELSDHRNRVRLDCQRTNLRVTDYAGNSRNRTKKPSNPTRKPSNPTGLLGVTRHKQTGKWQAQVSRGGIHHYCGLHDTPEAAGAVAAAKRIELDGKVFRPEDKTLAAKRPAPTRRYRPRGQGSVYFNKDHQRWSSCITRDGARRHAGYHGSREEAEAALAAKIAALDGT